MHARAPDDVIIWILGSILAGSESVKLDPELMTESRTLSEIYLVA